MDHAATATPIEVDTLLERVLEQPEAEWAAALETLCGSHPHAASSLRRRFALLAHTGLVAGVPRPEFLLPGQRFGNYQLLELVGAGGMGVVFRARRDGDGDDLALKVLRPELLAHETARARFLREAAALADVAHPAVCALADFGEHAGVPFLAMRFVRGRTLAAGIEEARRLARPSAIVGDGGGPPWQALTRLFARLAEGLAAVHARGLVHRDIKPENILVERGDQPVLIDFGLAGVLDATRLTRSGEPLGTPAYMAPEQVRGTPADARTDVYGLAATLYECVALRPPFLVAGREALYRAILDDDVPDVRLANPELPRSLALVLQKALQKEPAVRYASAQAFAAELLRVAEGKPVLASPVPMLRRAARWMRTHPRTTVAAALATCVLVLGVAALQMVERSARVASEGLAASSSALLASDVTVGALVAREAWRQVPDSVTTRSNLLLALSRNLQTAEFEVGSVTTGYVPSPDGGVALLLTDRVWLREGPSRRSLPETRLTGPYSVHHMSASWAHDGQSCLVAAFDGTLRRLARNGTPLRLAEPTFAGTAELSYGGLSTVQVVAARADGSFLVGDKQGGLRVVDNDGRTVASWKAPGAPEAVVFVIVMTDGMTFVTVDRRGEVLRWDRPAGTPAVLRAASTTATAACASADHRHIAVGDAAGDVHVVDVEGGSAGFTVRFGVPRAIEALALAPDASAVFASAIGQRWALWQGGKEPRLVVQHRHPQLVRGAAFSPRGDRVAFGDLAGRLTVLDLHGRKQLEIAAHHGAIFLVQFTDERTLVTGGFDTVVREWRLEVPGLTALQAHEYPALNAAWLPDGKSIVSSGADGRVVWTRVDGTRIDSYQYPGPGFMLWALGLSPDGRHVAVVGYNYLPTRAHRLRLDQEAQRLVKLEPEFGAGGKSAAWRDDHTVILGEWPGVLAGYDVTSGDRVQDWKMPGGARAHGWDMHIAVARDGRIATASQDTTVRLWRPDGTLERTLFVDETGVDAVEFAPDGNAVLVGRSRGWLGLLDLEGHVLREYGGGLSNVVMARFSPDGRFVGAIGNDGYLQVWKAGGVPWLRLPLPSLPSSLAFSPDSEQVAVACHDGAIHIWPVTEARIERLTRDIFRELTPEERQTFLGR